MMVIFSQRTRGFTLIELLVVIAILGILATVVLASLYDAQEQAREAAARQTARSVQPVAVICRNAEATVQAPNDVNTGGGFICSNSTVSPELWPGTPDQWQWSAAITNGNSDTFTFYMTNGEATTTCDINQCD